MTNSTRTARESNRSTARTAGPSASARIRTSARASARERGSKSSAVESKSAGEKKNSPKMKEMRARKAWLERQLLEVEEQLSTLPPDLE